MILGLTIYNRSPETIRAVFASLRFPGNRPDAVAVCYDRAPASSVAAVRAECRELGVELRESFLSDDAEGFRCPSKAWNAVFDLIDEDHAFCISSDVVLGPHSIAWAYHVARDFDNCIIVGKADHCGPSYFSTVEAIKDSSINLSCRTMTSSLFCNPLGFAWLLPMTFVRSIGGYSLDYMDGYCFEDNDFTIRMWNAGADIIFLDDVLALHMEHARPHVFCADKIAANRAIFVASYGDLNYLERGKGLKAKTWMSRDEHPGLAVWWHLADDQRISRLIATQRLYGHNNDWVAVPVKVHR